MSKDSLELSAYSKTALITGASSGIGYELAKLFAADGYQLVLVARNMKNLERAAGELKTGFNRSVKLIAKDMSDSKAPQEISAQLKNEGIKVDVLVNNAGFGLHGAFVDTSIDTEMNMLDVNVANVVRLTKLLLPDMIKQRSGAILNMASVAAFKPGPFMAMYYASKAFIVSFSEALAGELAGTGVEVSVLCPGPTATGFQKRAGIKNTLLIRGNMMTAEYTAKIGYRGLKEKKLLVVPGIKNKVLALGFRYLPPAWSIAFVRLMQDTFKE